jgi:Outer membrane protein
MKRELLSIALAAAMTISTAIPSFAADSGSTKTQETTSGSALTTTTGSSVTTTGEAVTVKEPVKKLSLNEAIKIMTTTGARAETANLNKQSDLAVAKGYSEKVSDIKKALNDIDFLESLPTAIQQSILTQKGVSSIAELSYDAQVEGATQSNKKIMALRRDFAKSNTENNYQADLNQIRQDTISIYNMVLLAEDNYKIAKDNLAAQQKNLKDIDAKKAVGLLSKKDVLQAQSALTDAEKEVRSAETKMEYAQMSFNYLLGYPVLQEVEFTDKLTETTSEAIDVEKAVKNALENRNEIKGADFATQIYKMLLDDVKAYPKSSSTYLNALIKYNTAEKTAKDARTQIEIDIRNRASDVADKKAALGAAKSLQSYAQEGMRLIKLTNEEGLSTVEDLLATQVSLYKANLNVANATSEYNLALEQFKDAQGVGTMRIPL